MSFYLSKTTFRCKNSLSIASLENFKNMISYDLHTYNRVRDWLYFLLTDLRKFTNKYYDMLKHLNYSILLCSYNELDDFVLIPQVYLEFKRGYPIITFKSDKLFLNESKSYLISGCKFICLANWLDINKFITDIDTMTDQEAYMHRLLKFIDDSLEYNKLANLENPMIALFRDLIFSERGDVGYGET